MQRAALCLTVLLPLVFWLLRRRFDTPRFAQLLCRSTAVALLALEGSEVAVKLLVPGGPIGGALPMQLCDWVLFAVAAALWFRWQLGFELGYFWGLAGTLQALLTPAIAPTEPWWRLLSFFFSHALIVAGVLHLLLSERCRPWPQSLPRVILCSEIYLVAALLANHLTGANYGFLSAKPLQPSLLDYFSDQHWLYVLQINLTALVFFPLLYLPWLAWDRWQGLQACAQRP